LAETVAKTEKDLQLDDESQVFQAKIVFKEQLTMYLLSTVIEVLRDLLLTPL